MIKDPDLIDRQAVTDLLEEIADKGEAMHKPGEDDLAYRRRTAIANAARTLIESVKALPNAVPAALDADSIERLLRAAKRITDEACDTHGGKLAVPVWMIQELNAAQSEAKAALSGKGA